MTWRSVVISRPAKLRREQFRLAVEQEQTAFVPFEDIAVIVLNHREITLTHPVLSACGEYGISLFATGDTHHPSGVFLPFLSHSRATRWMRLQLDLPRPIAKQTWATIVRQKITNQAACLHLAGREGADRMDSYARRVRSGDIGNLEGQAAAFYFVQLFGKGFHREQARFANAALDYGYAVLRGTIARGLVAHGLLPSIGLFHASEQNAFNLADDVIEPFRPVVDLFVAKHMSLAGDELNPQDKAALVGLLNVDVGMPRGKMSVLSAIEHSIESLARIYDGAAKRCWNCPPSSDWSSTGWSAEMSEETRRFMRLLVLFDLPVVSKAERRAYTLFRRFLINDGYDMIQFSVYGRIVNGNDALEKHMKRLVNSLPPDGSVRCLTVTEKQYASMKLLVGLPLFQEKALKVNQMLLF